MSQFYLQIWIISYSLSIDFHSPKKPNKKHFMIFQDALFRDNLLRMSQLDPTENQYQGFALSHVTHDRRFCASHSHFWKARHVFLSLEIVWLVKLISTSIFDIKTNYYHILSGKHEQCCLHEQSGWFDMLLYYTMFTQTSRIHWWLQAFSINWHTALWHHPYSPLP